jgi:hypothetical protein
VARGWTGWVASSEEVGGGERLWVEGRMTQLLGSDDARTLFVQGCVRNQVKFYDRFDAIVLLSASVEVMFDRIADRTTNLFKQDPCGTRTDPARPRDGRVAPPSWLLARVGCQPTARRSRRRPDRDRGRSLSPQAALRRLVASVYG